MEASKILQATPVPERSSPVRPKHFGILLETMTGCAAALTAPLYMRYSRDADSCRKDPSI